MKLKGQIRRRNLAQGKEDLEQLVALDFDVVPFSPYHFRINGRLDVWPSSKKWFDKSTGRHNSYDSLIPFVQDFFTSTIGYVERT
jgi:hypothetical protein